MPHMILLHPAGSWVGACPLTLSLWGSSQAMMIFLRAMVIQKSLCLVLCIHEVFNGFDVSVSNAPCFLHTGCNSSFPTFFCLRIAVQWCFHVFQVWFEGILMSFLCVSSLLTGPCKRQFMIYRHWAFLKDWPHIFSVEAWFNGMTP